jgi:hypothetical protein
LEFDNKSARTKRESRPRRAFTPSESRWIRAAAAGRNRMKCCPPPKTKEIFKLKLSYSDFYLWYFRDVRSRPFYAAGRTAKRRAPERNSGLAFSRADFIYRDF